MILPFNTQINGNPSYFIEKIWEGILRDEMFDHISDEYQYFRCLHRTKFGKNWDEYPDDASRMEFAKIHTIREDIHDRWRPMMNIHFTINNRSKNSFQFAPVIPCISYQIVFMSFSPTRGIEISIDDRYIYPQEKEKLAKQDGFKSFDEFEAYFTALLKSKPNSCARLKLIHWTKLLY